MATRTVSLLAALAPAGAVFVPGVTREAMAARAAFASNATSLATIEIPDNFDSEANWPECAKVIGDIRDQSNCGCCWAFAAASAASDRLCIATKGKVVQPFSANDVCFCASEDGCDGGDIVSPWEHIKKGAVSGGQVDGIEGFKDFCSRWPFAHCHHHGPRRDDPYPAEGQPGCPSRTSPQCPSKCDSDAMPEHRDFESDKYSFSGKILQVSGADAIAQAIMEGGPVETAFDVHEDFADYSGGIYEHKTGGMLGGHAVRIVGFGVESGKKYWKVANSWNPYWGEKGYFRIVRGSNNCGIEDMVTASPATATWSKGGVAAEPNPTWVPYDGSAGPAAPGKGKGDCTGGTTPVQSLQLNREVSIQECMDWLNQDCRGPAGFADPNQPACSTFGTPTGLGFEVGYATTPPGPSGQCRAWFGNSPTGQNGDLPWDCWVPESASKQANVVV